MQIDPVATLRCWQVDVDLAGHTITIPALPAQAWLVAVVVDGWAGVVPGLADVPDEVDDLIAAGRIRSTDCTRAARDALAAAGGCPWWTAQRLAHAVASHPLGPELALRAVDPSRLSLAAYLAAGYQAAARNLDKAKLARLDWQLDQPPAGIPAEEWWDEDAAAAGFMAAIGGSG